LAFAPASEPPVTSSSRGRSAPPAKSPAHREAAGAAAPPSAPAPVAATTAAPEGAPGDAASWVQIVEELGLIGMPKQLAQHCELVSRDERRIELRLSKAEEHFLEKSYKERLQAAL